MKKTNIAEVSIDNLIRTYVDAAIAHGKATDTGEYKKGNPQHDIIAGVCRELRRRGKIAQRSLLNLLEHENDYVRLWASAHALEFAPEQGEPVLKALSEDCGFVGLTAQTTLDEWRRGTLKFP